MGIIMDSFDVETRLREQLKDYLSPGVQIYIADEQYWLTPLKDITDLLERERIDLRTFRDEVHDCDNFALALHAAVSDSQFGNPKREFPHAFGQVWGMQDGQFGHAVNIMLNADGVVRMLEPQAEPDEAVMTPAECGMTGIWLILII